MQQVHQGPSRSTPPSTEVTPFARPTLEQYSTMIREQAGLKDLMALNVAFRGDPGDDVGVQVRSKGAGYEFTDSIVAENDHMRGAWLVFEKLPGDALRARAFKTLEGASAEFSTKLAMQRQGDVTMREFQTKPDEHRGRHIQVSFQGEGPQGKLGMVMAPISTALDQATRLFWGE